MMSDTEKRMLQELREKGSEVDRLRLRVQSLERLRLDAAKREVTAEELRQSIFSLTNNPVTPPDWMVERPTGIRTSGVPMTIWSDWHFGEAVDKAQVAGVNEFNREIGEQRVRTLVEKTILLAKHHMVRPTYPGIVVCLGGDMITGAIHEELANTNWGTPQEQFLAVQDSLAWGLEQMAHTFKKVFVPCVVGNHGRDTMKPRTKNSVQTSHEWVLYNQLEREFRNDKRFVFHVPDETDSYFSVYGHRFLLTHGDRLGVKGGDGIIGALGPIARGTFKVGRSEAQIERSHDTLIMGHWHTYIPRGDAVPAIVNGSLIGYNEYARLGLRVPYSRPSQALWFVHPDHGITAQWQIYLDDHHKSADSSEWVTFEERSKR